MLTTQQ